MFQILSLQKTPSQDGQCSLIEVVFSHTGRYGEDFTFGTLDKYYKSLVMLDKEKYESHYDTLLDDNEDIAAQIVSKNPSPYDLGYCKVMECSGVDAIEHLGNNQYKYAQYIATCYITEAAYKQLEEMKDHIEKGVCRWGNYPDQVGAFRSGDPFHDFVGVLETLDRFWD